MCFFKKAPAILGLFYKHIARTAAMAPGMASMAVPELSKAEQCQDQCKDSCEFQPHPMIQEMQGSRVVLMTI